MDVILLVACVTAGCLISFLLSFVRGARMERKLDELDRLVRLALREGDRAKKSAEALEELSHKVDEISSQVGVTTRALEGMQTTHSQSRTEEVHDMVERKLYNMGYESVRLSPDEDYDPEEAYRINLEVARRGVRYKGFAVVENGVITDSRISPTYAMFP